MMPDRSLGLRMLPPQSVQGGTRSAVLLRERPAIPLTLVTDAVRAIDPATGASLLEQWRRRGVQLVTSAELLEET